MGKWTAVSDRDYRDEPFARPTYCATRFCQGRVTFPDIEVYCSTCIAKWREQVAIANALVDAQRLKAKMAR